MFYSKVVRRFYEEKPMRQFGHQDPVDKHHTPVEVRWLKQLRRQLKRAERGSGDDWVRASRAARAGMIKRRMKTLSSTVGLMGELNTVYMSE